MINTCRQGNAPLVFSRTIAKWINALVLTCLVCIFPACANALERQKFPPGSPAEAVDSLLYGDFLIDDRDDQDRYSPKFGGIEHYPLDGLATMSDDRLPWRSCTVHAYISDYRISGTTPALLEGIRARKIDPNRAFVTVQMKVLGLWLWEEGHRTRPLQQCGWLGLKIHDDLTGKDDFYFDQLDDTEAFITQVKSFGSPIDVTEEESPKQAAKYLRIPKHRQHWEFGIAMYRDFKGVWRPEMPYFPPHTSLRENIKRIEKRILWHKKTLKTCTRNYLAESWCARNVGKPDPELEWIKPLLELNKDQ